MKHLFNPSKKIFEVVEVPVIANMHTFIEEKGYQPNGKHHEICLSDPRKVASEKLKTILRQPIK
jgi:hypothetical protein